MELLEKHTIGRHVIKIIKNAPSTRGFILCCTTPRWQDLASYYIDKFLILGIIRPFDDDPEPDYVLTLKGVWLTYLHGITESY